MKWDIIFAGVIAGAAMGVMVGYAAFNVGHNVGLPFSWWLRNGPNDAIMSAVLGGLAGAGIAHIFRHN